MSETLTKDEANRLLMMVDELQGEHPEEAKFLVLLLGKYAPKEPEDWEVMKKALDPYCDLTEEQLKYACEVVLKPYVKKSDVRRGERRVVARRRAHLRTSD